MDETPAGEPPDANRGEPGGVSRRAVLTGGLGLVAVAAGAGVAAGALRPLQSGPLPQPPAELTAALAAEQQLLDTIDASLRHDPALRQTLAPLRSNHAAHARALRAAVTDYPAKPPPRPSAEPARPLDRAALRAAEQLAAARAARRAAALGGRTAALLASIAACEATHADLLA